MVGFFILIILLLGLLIASMWTIFTKAGKPGWAAIVPIYNLIILCEIIQKPAYWVLLMLIPYVGTIWNIWSINLLMKKFGKSEAWTVGAIFLSFIFLPMLAFGDAQYNGEQKIDIE